MDLSSAHFVDSGDLGVLTFWKGRLEEGGGCLILASPSSSIILTLIASRQIKGFSVCGIVAEAVKLAMQRTASGRWKPVTV